MHKLQTLLALFRFNSWAHHGPIRITWYYLERQDLDEHGRCFTHQELATFQQYATGNPINFPKIEQYFLCGEGEGPYCNLYPRLPEEGELAFPSHLILRKTPQLATTPAIFNCMDILLLNTNGDSNHTYNLEFDVIGTIHKQE